jgi:hypothetical protein
MKNWRTTLLGCLGGLVLIVKGALIHDPAMVTTGVSTALMGYFAKDNSVTGTGA